jgi:hypothetical protein
MRARLEALRQSGYLAPFVAGLALAALAGVVFFVVRSNGGPALSAASSVAYAREGSDIVELLSAGDALNRAEADLGEEVYLPRHLPDAALKLVSIDVDDGPTGPAKGTVDLVFVLGDLDEPSVLSITVIEHLRFGVQPGTPNPTIEQIEGGTLYSWLAPDEAADKVGRFIDTYTLVSRDGPSFSLLVISAVASVRPPYDEMVAMIQSFVPRSEID